MMISILMPTDVASLVAGEAGRGVPVDLRGRAPVHRAVVRDRRARDAEVQALLHGCPRHLLALGKVGHDAGRDRDAPLHRRLAVHAGRTVSESATILPPVSGLPCRGARDVG